MSDGRPEPGPGPDDLPAADADADSLVEPEVLGGIGGLGDMGGLLESAQEALSAHARVAAEVVEGSAGGGVVRVEMTGAGEVLSVALAPEVVDPDEVEMLQDLVVAALHDAAAKVTALQREALGPFGGIDLGGLGGFGPPGSPG
jgi:hypothetical protein